MLGGCNKKRFAITPPELLHGVDKVYIKKLLSINKRMRSAK